MTRVLAAAALIIASSLLHAQQATFSSRAYAVRVDVAATDRGRPVLGLSAADFEVFDNGVRQEVALVEAGEVPVSLSIALDVSGSVTGERLTHLRAASALALGALAKGDTASLLTFSHQVSLVAPRTPDIARVRESFSIAPSQGYTSLVDATYAALVQADAGEGRGLAIVFSDGVDTTSWLTPRDVIETARRIDAVMFGISSGAPGRTVLDQLADSTGGDLIRIEGTEALGRVLEKLMRDFRQRYLLSFEPRSVTAAGWHKLDVRVKRRGVAVKSRAGYFGS